MSVMTDLQHAQLILALEDAKLPAPDLWVIRCYFSGQGRGRGWKVLKWFFPSQSAAVAFAENLSRYYLRRCVFKLPG
jgi:hypothetical protein